VRPQSTELRNLVGLGLAAQFEPALSRSQVVFVGWFEWFHLQGVMAPSIEEPLSSLITRAAQRVRIGNWRGPPAFALVIF
jgi:hypothetical protein